MTRSLIAGGAFSIPLLWNFVVHVRICAADTRALVSVSRWTVRLPAHGTWAGELDDFVHVRDRERGAPSVDLREPHRPS